MSEWDEYDIEASTPHEWSEDQIRAYIEDMLEDYHWENVAPLLEQIAGLGKTPRKANQYVFRPRRNENYSREKHKEYFHSIGSKLAQEGFIYIESISNFVAAFDGVGLPDGKHKVEWLGQKNLCTFMIDELIDRKIITDHQRNINAEFIFGIKQAANLRGGYHKRPNMKPAKYEVINRILNFSSI